MLVEHNGNLRRRNVTHLKKYLPTKYTPTTVSLNSDSDDDDYGIIAREPGDPPPLVPEIPVPEVNPEPVPEGNHAIAPDITVTKSGRQSKPPNRMDL